MEAADSEKKKAPYRPAPRQPRRTDLQLAHDRAVLADIALKNPGATPAQLADMLCERTDTRLAPRTIRDELDRIREIWLTEAVEDFGALKAEELARIKVLEQEAWDAWNQSKSDFLKEVIEQARRPPAGKPDAGDIISKIVAELADKNAYLNEEVVETIVYNAVRAAIEDSVSSGEDSETFVSKIINTRESRIGDVRYWRAIHEAQQERRKILGVYAPELHRMDIRKFEIKGYAGWSPDVWEKEDNVVEGEVVDPPKLKGGE